ncbi:response regulator transcription factor [Flavihumibacter sp. RY-1]|uniref:Response regulator transcription factor n=1 Tax=Flavihumibacter fluminis TaxID=2909236 RepID=A0ABS9BKE4_9BACT|nr:response regulator transcription factor [Flavihumibacter fluminis]MCF1716151.1 response regulator transcription factor [Flavihumibacter fluminis]
MAVNIHIAIVDDNKLLIKSVREKLALFPDIRISFTANNGLQCMDQLLSDRTTDLVLMDIEMPEQNGIITTALIKRNYPQIKVIVLTVFDDDENIFNAIQAGADGYLLKEIPPSSLHDAIIQTLEGGAVMTPSIAMKTLQLMRSPLHPETISDGKDVLLSERETEVLEQLSRGLPYTAIAENLIISPSTVRRHIENIYKKLQVHSKIEAIELAKKKRII